MVTTTENGKKGKVYHAIGSPFHGYTPEIKSSYDIGATKRRYTRTLLSRMDDAWLDHVEQVARSLPAAGKSPNPLDPFAGENCQDWAMEFLKELVNMGALDASALSIVETCPKE
ncbi:phosphotransferase family [Fusarium sp. NRRL 52700]|nr:phosphotransferase family [Fusarium sp. NRRL 52700]